MSFVVIPRHVGTTYHGRETVTVSYGTVSAKGGLAVRCYIGAPISRDMGFGKGVSVEIAYCADTNRLRVAKTEGVGRKCSMNGSTTQIAVPLSHITLGQKKPAQLVKHTIENGALILKLPEWAWDPARRAAREAADKVRRGAA